MAILREIWFHKNFRYIFIIGVSTKPVRNLVNWITFQFLSGMDPFHSRGNVMKDHQVTNLCASSSRDVDDYASTPLIGELPPAIVNLTNLESL